MGFHQLLVLLCVIVYTHAGPDRTRMQLRELELIREIAEEIRETSEPYHVRSYGTSAADMVSAYNKPSLQTIKMAEERHNRELELGALKLVVGDDAEILLRELKGRRASSIDYCTIGPTLTCDFDSPYRTFDGTCNNENNPEWGMAMAQHKRRYGNVTSYADDVWRRRTHSSVPKAKRDNKFLPHERKVSNAIHKATTANLFESDLSIAIFAFGQFLDHDFASTPEGPIPQDVSNCCDEWNDVPKFCMPINVTDSSFTDDFFPSDACFDAKRSDIVDLCSDTSVKNQFNQITSFIDASNVYGSSKTESDALRTKIGGRLTDTNKFPPAGVVSACRADEDEDDPTPCMHTGDDRSNVFTTLGTLHVLWLREHNRIADLFAEIHKDNSTWTDEKIFQETRRIIIAMMQKITYGDFLPHILNATIMSDYGLNLTSGLISTYNSSVDPTLANSFMIAFRFGHSLIPNFVKKMDDNYVTTSTVDAAETYLTPHELYASNYMGINDIGRFLSGGNCPKMDSVFEDVARNRLFEKNATAKDGMDLMTINLRREREWGVRPYYVFRDEYSGETTSVWDDLTDHTTTVINSLKEVYNQSDDDSTVKDIDLLTGLLTETAMAGSILGPTLNNMLAQQFQELKDGDRFWFENANQSGSFLSNQLTEIYAQTLSKIICRNLVIQDINEDVFNTTSSLVSCSSLNSNDINLSLFGI